MSLKSSIVSSLTREHLALGHRIFNKPGRPGGSKPRSLALIACVVKHTTTLTNQEILSDDIITDSSDDGGIDAIYFDQSNKTIFIYDVKGGRQGFGAKDICNLITTVKGNILDKPIGTDGLNTLITRKIERAQSACLDHDWSIRLIIARPLHDLCLHGREPQRLKDFLDEYRVNVRHECLCSKHFVTCLTSRRQESHEYRLMFTSNDVLVSNIPKRVDNKPSTIIGTVHLSNLVEMRHELGEIVFDDNVRLDQEDEDLSAGVLRTLKDNAQDFYLYHNGFTISCDVIKRIGARVFSLTNPRVINGCQSLSVIYRARLSLERQLNQAPVLCRVYGLQSRTLIEAICQSTNTQKKIEPWDLRTNDEIIKLIDIFLSEFGFIRRKCGRIRKGFLLPDLTQWIYSCKYGEPAFAKNKKRALFDVAEGPNSLYHKKIYNDSKLTLKQLERIVKIGLLVSYKIERERRDEVKRLCKYADFHIMAALYKMHDYDGRKYGRVINALTLIINSQRGKLGDEFSYNKAFTKSNDVWIALKHRLYI